MWIAKHKDKCQKRNDYQVIRTVIINEDALGHRNGHKPLETVTAICNNCNAPAEWVEK